LQRSGVHFQRSIQRDVPRVLLAFQIFSTSRQKTLHGFFKPFQGEYRIRWIDESQAMILFSSKTSMLTAFNQLNQPYAEYKLKLLTDSAVDITRLTDNGPIPYFVSEKLRQLFNDHDSPSHVDLDSESLRPSPSGDMTQSDRTWILTDDLAKSSDGDADAQTADPFATPDDDFRNPSSATISGTPGPSITARKDETNQGKQEEEQQQEEEEEVVDDWTKLCSSIDDDEDGEEEEEGFIHQKGSNSFSSSFSPNPITIAHRNAFSELSSSFSSSLSLSDSQDQDQHQDQAQDQTEE